MKQRCRTCVVIVAITLFISVICLGFYGVRLSIPFVLMTLSDQIVKKQLDNPYINENFVNWKEVEVHDIGSLMIPADWNLTYSHEEKSLFLSDGDERQVAVGFVYKSEEGLRKGRTDQDLYASMATHIGFTPYAAEYHVIPEFISLEGCEFKKVRFYNGLHSCDFLSLSLVNGQQHEMVILFPSVDGNEFSSLLSIVEAIVYSFVF